MYNKISREAFRAGNRVLTDREEKKLADWCVQCGMNSQSREPDEISEKILCMHAGTYILRAAATSTTFTGRTQNFFIHRHFQCRQ